MLGVWLACLWPADAYKHRHRTHQHILTNTQNALTYAYKHTEHINISLQTHRTHQHILTNTQNTSMYAYKHIEHINICLQTHRTHQHMPTDWFISKTFILYIAEHYTLTSSVISSKDEWHHHWAVHKCLRYSSLALVNIHVMFDFTGKHTSWLGYAKLMFVVWKRTILWNVQ